MPAPEKSQSCAPLTFPGIADGIYLCPCPPGDEKLCKNFTSSASYVSIPFPQSVGMEDPQTLYFKDKGVANMFGLIFYKVEYPIAPDMRAPVILQFLHLHNGSPFFSSVQRGLLVWTHGFATSTLYKRRFSICLWNFFGAPTYSIALTHA
jgi:hypothetical protein